jgi:hypothetical protein
MKTLLIMRGGSLNPIQIIDDDNYDSVQGVYDENGQLQHSFNHVSTIPSFMLFGQNQYKLHGILAEGTYCGIWTQNLQLGWHFVLFNTVNLSKVNSVNDLTELMETFPSVKPNPSMENQLKISEVCIHSGVSYSNGSEGCLTLIPQDFPSFASLFQLNEKIYVVLNTVAGYKYPAW